MDSYNIDSSYNGEEPSYTNPIPDDIDLLSPDNRQIPEAHVGDLSQTDNISSSSPLGVANNMNVASDFYQYPINQDVSETLGDNDFQSQLDNIMKPNDNFFSDLSNKTEINYNENLTDIKNQIDVLNKNDHGNLIKAKQDTSFQTPFGCTGCATKCLHTCSGACFTSCSGSCDGSSSGR